MILYFGNATQVCAGHFLYGPGLSRSRDYERLLPFDMRILDQGLIDKGGEGQYASKTQDGTLHVSTINGWLVVSFWDQSGDSRPGSCSAFIFSPDEIDTKCTEMMIEKAASVFPTVFSRPRFPIVFNTEGNSDEC